MDAAWESLARDDLIVTSGDARYLTCAGRYAVLDGNVLRIGRDDQIVRSSFGTLRLDVPVGSAPTIFVFVKKTTETRLK